MREIIFKRAEMRELPVSKNARDSRETWQVWCDKGYDWSCTHMWKDNNQWDIQKTLVRRNISAEGFTKFQ